MAVGFPLVEYLGSHFTWYPCNMLQLVGWLVILIYIFSAIYCHLLCCLTNLTENDFSFSILLPCTRKGTKDESSGTMCYHSTLHHQCGQDNFARRQYPHTHERGRERERRWTSSKACWYVNSEWPVPFVNPCSVYIYVDEFVCLYGFEFLEIQ